MSILVGQPVTTWTWTQWDTRPCPVVYNYQGEGKADGQMNGHRMNSLSSVSLEDHDTYVQQVSLLLEGTTQKTSVVQILHRNLYEMEPSQKQLN